MALLPVETSFNIDLEFETAPFHFRLFAWLIDGVLLWLFKIFLFWALSETFGYGFMRDGFGFFELLLTVPFICYHLLCELFLNGQSIGKKVLGIKVVSLTGKQATTGQYIIRWLLRPLDFGFIFGYIILILQQEYVLGSIFMISSLVSFIVFITSAYNQRFGDLAAGTSVILKKAPYKLSDTIFKEVDLENYTVTYPQVMKLSDRDINTINNILNQKGVNKSRWEYIARVCMKIKEALQIDSTQDDYDFLHTLMTDYNYLSRK